MGGEYGGMRAWGVDWEEVFVEDDEIEKDKGRVVGRRLEGKTERG